MLTVWVLPLAVVEAQLPDVLGSTTKKTEYVSFTAEPQSVPAGKPSVIELRFRVFDGFHINSHKPAGELLIATQLSVGTADGVRTGAPGYPVGVPYAFSSSLGEKLDVYTGPFTLKLPVIAASGEHTLNGSLRYQACDQAACYPPKTLPVAITFAAH